MILGVREYALIAVVVAVGALGWRWWHLEGEVREQARVLGGYAMALEKANDRIKGLDEALAGKLDKDAAGRREVGRRERGLDDAKREDESVRAWADTPIPARVRDLDRNPDGSPASGGVDPAVRD